MTLGTTRAVQGHEAMPGTTGPCQEVSGGGSRRCPRRCQEEGPGGLQEASQEAIQGHLELPDGHMALYRALFDPYLTVFDQYCPGYTLPPYPPGARMVCTV